ncbi:hypothetical protein [Aeoliella sp.]|uniref:hypothetical protein n=1 Tax=Aeoliella sp. TaxID=2795800 RepID=UPI003CCB8B94
MWCQHCGQDVPAITAGTGVPAECSRCGRPASRKAEALKHEASETTTSEEWSTDRRLRHIGRSLRTPLKVSSNSDTGEATLHWVDTLALPAGSESTKQRKPTVDYSRAARARRAGDRRMQIVAWLALVLGLGLAAGGVTLVGMGMFGEEPRFWQWGVGVTLAGQAVLIGGLVRVLTSLWNASRAAARRVVEMQHELAEVGRTAEAIIAQRPGGPSGFYGELARGASPALLLANLKGQIDHLATRLHQDI